MIGFLPELVLFTVFLTVTVFTIIMYSKTKFKEEKSKDKNYFKEHRTFKKMMHSRPVIWMDKYLKDAGYPYGITMELYIFMILISFFASVYLSMRIGYVQAAKALIIPIIFLNSLIYYRSKQRKQQIQLELCNIQDIIYFQSRIGTSQDVILAYAARTAREPLKAPLRALSDRYKYFSKDIEKAFDEFRKTTDLMEFQAFSFILEQREKTGYSEENHRAQAAMLKRSKRMGRRIQREYKRVKLIVASILMFGCYALFVTVPLLKTILKSTDIILR